MDANLLAALKAKREAEEREARNFTHEKFLENFFSRTEKSPEEFIGEIYEPDPMNSKACKRDSHGERIRPIAYGEDEKVIICPEPLSFIDMFQDIMDDQLACQKRMRKLLSGEYHYNNMEIQQVKLDRTPRNNFWFNSTSKGINLRPGLLNGEKEQPYAIPMNDIQVHGLIAGRTGSGKSVFINNLILNLLMEYSPWELDLYLADFKKVELSRYMSRYRTPHLRTCAATSEIRYVITMLTYLSDCMVARQELFTRLGVQKISEFRSKYGVVLPRVVLIIDEFQQMFMEATSRESILIDSLLMSIIKLGRATGFHLIFASQEMSGALSAKAMANFKIRFALSCDAAVSSTIIGNAEAARLERGYVLVNTGSGKVEENKKFRVPMIPDNEMEDADGNVIDSYFYGELKKHEEEAKNFSFFKKKTFYQEDAQERFENLQDILKKESVQRARKNILKNPQYFDVMTLGRSVVYSEKKYDLETFIIERGKNKNILVSSPSVYDLCYVQQLFVQNFSTSSIQNYSHLYFNFNPLMAKIYHLSDHIAATEYTQVEYWIKFRERFQSRMALVEAAKINEFNIEKFIERYFEKLRLKKANNIQKQYDDTKASLLAKFQGITQDNFLNRCEELQKKDARADAMIKPLRQFYEHQVEKKEWEEIFAPTVCWISGIEYMEDIRFAEYSEFMKNAMSVNMIFIMFLSSEDKNFSNYVTVSDYVFVGGNNEKFYSKSRVDFTKKSENSIVIDFKIRSMNTQRSFKKYRIDKTVVEAPRLEFDELLEE